MQLLLPRVATQMEPKKVVKGIDDPLYPPAYAVKNDNAAFVINA